MDEMTAVCELRADAPVPDRARLAPGRIRLVRATERTSRARTRLGRRWAAVAAAAAVAVVTVAALVVPQLVTGSGERSVRPAAPPVVRTDDLEDAATVLNRAADAVERLPDPKPRAGQWVYQKTMRGHESKPQSGPAEQEHWYPYVDPRFENGKEGDDHSFRERYELVDRLPADPERTLATARASYPPIKGESRSAHSFRASRVLADTYPVPPGGLARLYRAMATIDGLKVVDRLVEDARGRGAIAVYLPERDDAFQDQMLFDPQTFTCVGQRVVATKAYSFGKADPLHPDDTKAGDVLINSLVLESGLVDRKGQRP
ncbi:CU044_5270 family protein [Streptomyces meridianus]|uniref:CU044_5270 family protein n=1 Tax=Streptomyces meridianus TaxID=2938945 RepID=A0ABT0X724_9ACTN|nr:CU044_5270 family protein [Streptomyces meridianus]MCM2577579.1 CU044_5270 family protein [Streptomyces meridianus]